MVMKRSERVTATNNRVYKNNFKISFTKKTTIIIIIIINIITIS